MDLISIIVPVYNVKKYLNECINSLINQTYKNIEILLIDDGSTDGCYELCDMWAELEDRIKVFHKENGGLSDARNYGIKRARGKYIAFVDSDDAVNLKMYEKLHKNMIEYSASISVCERVVFGENIQTINYGKSNEIRVLDSLQAMDILLIDQKYKSHAWNKLYARELFENIEFPVGKYFEDVFIMHRLFAISSKIVFLDEGLYYYRQRGSSIVHSNDIKIWMDFLEALANRYEFCKKKSQRIIIQTRLLEAVRITKKIVFSDKTIKEEQKKYNQRINEYYDKYCRGYERCEFNKIAGVLFRFFPRLSCQFADTFLVDWLNYFIKLRNYMKGKDKDTEQALREVIKKLKSDNKKRIVLMGSPEYNNLGDLAIAYTIEKFLKDNCSTYHYVEISEKIVFTSFKKIKKLIRKEDIIIFMGGGNLGDCYLDQQRVREIVITELKKNRIIVFPQTIYFKNMSDKNKELKKTKRLFASNRITVFARETESYKIMNQIFHKCRIKLVPDIVLYNQLDLKKVRKKKILICLRDDFESTMSVIDKNNIMIEMNRIMPIDTYDTILNNNVDIIKREDELAKAVNKISEYQLVITDRLHGMIFCAITNTPCIVLNTFNHKIRSSYEWLSDLSFLFYAKDFSELVCLAKQILNKKIETKFIDRNLFEPLLKEINLEDYN